MNRIARFSISLAVVVVTSFASGQDAPNAGQQPPKEPQATKRPGILTPTGTRGDVYVDTSGFPSGTEYSRMGVLLAPNATYPSAGVKLGNSVNTDAFKVFNASNQQLLAIFGDGTAAFGPVTTTEANLHVQGGQIPLAVFSGQSAGWGFYVYDNTRVGGVPGGVTVGIAGPATSLVAGNMVIGANNSSTINAINSTLELNGWVDSDTTVGRANSPKTFRVLNSGVSSFAGSIGIGTSSPVAKLHVLNTDSASTRGILTEQITDDPVGAAIAARKARVDAAGLKKPVQANDNVLVMNPSGYDGAGYVMFSRMFFTVDGTVSAGTVPTAIRFTSGSNAETERMRITSAGNVLIGLTAPSAVPGYAFEVGTSAKIGTTLRVGGTITGFGDANFTGTVTGGNIKAKYQDVAEWVPSKDMPAPGTVVVLDPSSANHVMASTRAYDTAVAGVVSPQPGITLGEEGDSKSLVATTGRVRVRVDATEHPIAIGDLLVTSNRRGVAMKSIPIDLGGIAIHRPGTVVGKALESLSGGEGEILVLLSLQ